MKGDTFKMSVVEKSVRDGKPYPGGLERWAINTFHYKAEIQDRWKYSLDEPGSWSLPRNMVDIGETYLKHVTSETLANIEVKGRPVQRFVLMNGRDNHLLDCEVYSHAGADMVVAHEWDNLQDQFDWAAHAGDQPIVDYQDDQEIEFSPR